MVVIHAKCGGKGKTLVKHHAVEQQVFQTPPPTESEATEANTSGLDVTTSTSSIFSSAAASQAGNESNLSPVPSDNELNEPLVCKSIAKTMQPAVSSTPSGSINPKWAATPIKKPRHRTAKKTNGF